MPTPVSTTTIRILLAGDAAGVSPPSRRLAGCGAGVAQRRPATLLRRTRSTLRFTWWGSDARHKRTQQVIELFAEGAPEHHRQGRVQGVERLLGQPRHHGRRQRRTGRHPDGRAVPRLVRRARRAARPRHRRRAPRHRRLRPERAGHRRGRRQAVRVADRPERLLDRGQHRPARPSTGVELPDDATWTWDDLKAIGAEVTEASGGKVTGVQSWGFDAGGLNIWARQAGAVALRRQGQRRDPAGRARRLLELPRGPGRSRASRPTPSVTVERAGAGSTSPARRPTRRRSAPGGTPSSPR